MLIMVKDLVPVTLTRKRGEEAFSALRARLDRQNVEVDLDGSAMLSSSFLDELILKLAESGLLKRVVFVTRQAITLHKLGIIAHERNLTLYSKESDSDIRLKSIPRLARAIVVPEQK